MNNQTGARRHRITREDGGFSHPAIIPNTPQTKSPAVKHKKPPVSTGEKIGWVGWGHASDKRIGDRDFGYAIVPAHWNKGYMTEAMVAVLAYIFAEDDANSVFGECDALNHGSSGVMKKAGMHLVREWEEERADGRTYPMHRYLISRSQRVGR